MADIPKLNTSEGTVVDLIKDAAAIMLMVGITCTTIIAFAITAVHVVDWLNAFSALVARMFVNA